MKFCYPNHDTGHTKWKPYAGTSNSSYLDWYFCDKNAVEIPIRDVSRKGKTEPHYEDRSFNLSSRCNRLLLRGAISRNERYIFFFTRYTGSIKKFRDKFFITGYYKIDKICNVSDKDYATRHAVLADKPKFVKIQDALPLQDIIKCSSKNSRHIPKRLTAKKVSRILRYFQNKKNEVKKYTKETELQNSKKDIIQISSLKK